MGCGAGRAFPRACQGLDSLFHGKNVALSHLPNGLPHLLFYFLKICKNVFEEFICPSNQSLLEPVPITGWLSVCLPLLKCSFGCFVTFYFHCGLDAVFCKLIDLRFTRYVKAKESAWWYLYIFTLQGISSAPNGLPAPWPLLWGGSCGFCSSGSHGFYSDGSHGLCSGGWGCSEPPSCPLWFPGLQLCMCRTLGAVWFCLLICQTRVKMLASLTHRL